MDKIDSGIYVLKIYMKEPKNIKVGALGKKYFNKGYYFYIGTAQKNLQKRVARHLKNKKNFHWHIDYFLDKADVMEYYTLKGPKNYECKLFKYLKDKKMFKAPIAEFGSSDCNCISHLLFSDEEIELENILADFKQDIQ